MAADRVVVRRPLALIVGCLAAGLALMTSSTVAYATSRPFSPKSSFNVKIRSHPKLDRNSAAMVRRISRAHQANANLYAFGIPIYTAPAGTPRYPIRCVMEGVWGPCPLSRQPMPIPASARPSTGSDGVLVVIDPTTRTIGEYWQARKDGSAWSASWGAVNYLDGSGWGGGSTGAGASRLAGVVRVSEIENRSIKHALVVQTDTLCADVVRKPALKTDGTSTRSDCLPAGARIQLDPKIKLSTIKGITPAERAVARALQVYGAYVIDRGGAPLSVSFERAPDATESSVGSVYRAAGLRWDYDGLDHIPWHRLRVLRTWKG